MRYQNRPAIARSARPATSIPVIAPARNAVVRPDCRLCRAASAVRTLARTEMFMPMKPVAPDRTAPITKAAALRPPRKSEGCLRGVHAAGNRAKRWSVKDERDQHARRDAAKADQPLAEREARDRQCPGAQNPAFPAVRQARRRR